MGQTPPHVNEFSTESRPMSEVGINRNDDAAAKTHAVNGNKKTGTPGAPVSVILSTVPAQAQERTRLRTTERARRRSRRWRTPASTACSIASITIKRRPTGPSFRDS